MFNPFKKKPTELKYGRDNYVQDYHNYINNDRNWILLLSSLFIEVTDIELGIKNASHDLLSIYPMGDLDSYDEGELAEKSIYEDMSALQNRLMEIFASNLSNVGVDLYYALNLNSLKEVQKKAKERYAEPGGAIEFYTHVFNEKETYTQTHMRTGEIAHMMWQIRLAVYLGMIKEEFAWQILEELSDILRPLMTLFPSWKDYNVNLNQFYRIYDIWEHAEDRKYLEEVTFCFLVREESPFNFISIETGIHQDYAYNVKNHSNILPKRLDSKDTPLIHMITELLNKKDKGLLWKEMQGLKIDEHEEAFRFIVSQSDKSKLPEKVLKKLPELYPNFYAYAMRAKYYYILAWDARGQSTIDTVDDKHYAIFQKNLKLALSDLFKAHKLAPKEKLIWHHSYEILSLIDGDELSKEKTYFYDLILREGLDHRGCIYVISRFKADRWGGSFQENLEWAREVIDRTEVGNPVRSIIFDVMIEWESHLSIMEEDPQAAYEFVTDPDVQAEVNPYFEELLASIDQAPYEIASTLLHWSVLTQNHHRIRQVTSHMKVGKFDLNAMNNGYHDDYTEVMMNWLRTV